MALRTTVFLVLIGFLAVNKAQSSRRNYGVATNYPEKLNYIDYELLKSVCLSKPGNVLISPASVKTLLGLLLEGAEGRTATQMLSALRLDDPDTAFSQLHKFQLSLKPAGLRTTDLNVGNRVFLSDKTRPKHKYESVLAENYDAEVELVNMVKTEETANHINNWVNNNTHGLIPKLIEPGSLDPKALLVVTNAIYFHALWETAFESRNTGSHCFKVGSKCQYTPMMEVVGFFRHALTDFGQIIEIDYKDKRYSMVIALPTDENGIDKLVRDVTFLNINSILSTLNKSEIWLTLPRFSVEYDAELVPNLKELGIRDVFEETADLSRMVIGDKTPAVSKIFHKAKIQVTEEGATAGAASGAVVVPLMGSALPRFAATHPFLFFIRDVQTGGLLFAGRLSVPEIADDLPSYQHPSSSQSPLPSSSLPPSSSQSPESGRPTRPQNLPQPPESFAPSGRPPRPESPPTTPSPPPSTFPQSTSSSLSSNDPTTTPGGIPLDLQTSSTTTKYKPSNQGHYSGRPKTRVGTTS